jgi:hypothetical protein
LVAQQAVRQLPLAVALNWVTVSGDNSPSSDADATSCHQVHLSRGDCGLYGKFAGILQGKIRQRVSSVRMLMIVACEGNMRSRWSRDP